MVNVAVVGTGAWGLNHVRAYSRAQDATLTVVCDESEEALVRARGFAPRAQAVSSFAEVLRRSDVDAIVLATPAVSHAAQACAVLEAGKSVLVEKPLALNRLDAEAVVRASERSKGVLMVGHLMLFHPAFQRLKAMVGSGELGRILYMYAVRVNLGRVRRDENAMWSLAPHDLSMMLALTDDEPVSVSARGGAYLQEGVEDVVFLSLRFASGVLAQIQLSWLDPRKERRLTIVGSQKMVEFDDGHPVEKLRVYDKGFDRPPSFTEFSEFLSIRNGDIHIPRVPMAEPLEIECRHFLECVRTGARPLTDGASALLVVRVLEAAQRSLLHDGRPEIV
jgi:predicted dehydrogenase